MRAVFLGGSTMRHVLLMTGASSIGLVAMFVVDVADLFFITMLGDQQLVAAVGFSGTLLFFLLSLGIGLQIALGALVARSEGRGDRHLAGEYCTSAIAVSVSVAVLCAIGAYALLPELLTLLGASGNTLDHAIRYTQIQLLGVPVLILTMCLSSALRAVGDARRSMLAMVFGAVANALLDPLFIFYFGWGIEGAAWASVVARFVILAYSASALLRVHRLPRTVSPSTLRAQTPAIALIAVPAVLTNLATPLANSLVLRIMADFGDGAVAALAAMARLAPLSFAAVFAVSGAVGPIIAQNAGAGRYDRVRNTLRDASTFIFIYVGVVWLLLVLAAGPVTAAFTTSEAAASLVRFYLFVMPGAFAVNGLLFVANASFNNLGRAYLATLFNYAKVFLGIVPAAYIGAVYFGPRGVMVGEGVGMVLFGALGMVTASLLVRRLAHEAADAASPAAARGAG